MNQFDRRENRDRDQQNYHRRDRDNYQNDRPPRRNRDNPPPQSQLLPRPRYKGPPKESNALFLKNLPNDLTKEEITNIFSQYGEIARFTQPKNKPGKAFLTYYDIRAAVKAKEELPKLSLRNRSPIADFAYKPPVYSGHQADETCSRISLKKISSDQTPDPSEDDIKGALIQFGEVSKVEQISGAFLVTFYDFRCSHKASAAGKVQILNSFYSIELSVDNDEPVDLIMPGEPGFDHRSDRRDGGRGGDRGGGNHFPPPPFFGNPPQYGFNGSPQFNFPDMQNQGLPMMKFPPNFQMFNPNQPNLPSLPNLGPNTANTNISPTPAMPNLNLGNVKLNLGLNNSPNFLGMPSNYLPSDPNKMPGTPNFSPFGNFQLGLNDPTKSNQNSNNIPPNNAQILQTFSNSPAQPGKIPNPFDKSSQQMQQPKFFP